MDSNDQPAASDQTSAAHFQSFAIETRGDAFSNELQARLKRELIGFGMTYDESEPGLVLSVGGDGTLLQAFHRYSSRIDQLAFVGVHTGHLGFYADWTAEDIDSLIAAIKLKKFTRVIYPLLHVKVSYMDKGQEMNFLALNECTIRSTTGLLVADVSIKNELFESFRGDGLCFSTPTGSTAYNKGLAGAIVHPSLASIQLTEIASINNRVYRTLGSPIILPKHHNCQVQPVEDTTFNLTIDHLSTIHERVQSIECSVAKEKICFARFRPFPFWRRVRDSFIG
ncbi:MAG: NAD kinase [Sporolactobacillus sp.]